MAETDWTIVVALVMLFGLLMTVIPAVPGVLLIWAAALGYGFATGFSALAVVCLVIITALLVASWVTSILVPHRVAQEHGTSRAATLGAMVGGIVGFFAIPVLGLIIGALIGVLCVEYWVRGDLGEAWQSTRGWVRGFGISVLIELALGVVMVLVWGVWAVSVLT